MKRKGKQNIEKDKEHSKESKSVVMVEIATQLLDKPAYFAVMIDHHRTTAGQILLVDHSHYSNDTGYLLISYQAL